MKSSEIKAGHEYVRIGRYGRKVIRRVVEIKEVETLNSGQILPHVFYTENDGTDAIRKIRLGSFAKWAGWDCTQETET